MGIDRMHDYLAQFGLGEKSGIDLDGESPGLLPSRDWKQRRWKQVWYPGETVIAGIGQGYHLTTPLQLATATAMLANGGKRIEPRPCRRGAIRSPAAPLQARGAAVAINRRIRGARRHDGRDAPGRHRIGSGGRRLHDRRQDRHRSGRQNRARAYDASQLASSIATMRCSLRTRRPRTPPSWWR
jgi:hypothetical protein